MSNFRSLPIFSTPEKFEAKELLDLRKILAAHCGDAPMTADADLKFPFPGQKVQMWELENAENEKLFREHIKHLGLEMKVTSEEGVYPLRVSTELAEQYWR